MKYINWFGLESHPSDCLISWDDENPVELALEYRKLWNLLCVDENSTNSLKKIIEKCREVAKNEVYYDLSEQG